jgi:hypothetical protein
MILGAILLVAFIYFIYIPYKAWRLSKNPEWIENKKKIKKLEAEYEEAKLEAEKYDYLAEEGTESFKKSNDYATELSQKELEKAIQRLAPKSKK